MARLVKFLLAVVAAVVGVGVLASIALFLFFDPNDFRDDIAQAVLYLGSDAGAFVTGQALSPNGGVHIA